MQNTLIEKQRSAPARSMTAFTVWTSLLGLAILGCGSLDREARADGLSWKLKAGEVLRYAVEEKMTTTSKVMEKENKANTTRTINLSWTVKGVSAAGDADIALRFERVRMHIEQPPYMPYDLDSSAAKTDAPEPFGSMAQQLKAMAGAEFTFKLKPNGVIEDFKVPDNTLKTLRAGLPEAAAQGMFSEQGLKDLFLQSAPPAFPENASDPGRSWTSKPAKIPSPLGNVVVEKTFTTLGPDPQNPALVLIGTETKLSIEPQENAGISAKIQSQEGKGSMTFDTASGRIEEHPAQPEDAFAHRAADGSQPEDRPDDRDNLDHDDGALAERRSDDPVLFQLAEKGASRHSEQACCDALVALGFIEDVEQPLPFIGEEFRIPLFRRRTTPGRPRSRMTAP